MVTGKGKTFRKSFAAYSMMFGFYYFAFTFLYSFYSVHMLSMGFLPSKVSLAITICQVVTVLTNFLVSIIVNDGNRRTLGVVMVILACTGAAGLMICESFVGMALSYALASASFGCLAPVCELIGANSRHNYGRIRVFGTWGCAIAMQIAGLIYDHISPRAVYGTGIIGFLLFLIGFIGTQEKNEKLASAKKPDTGGEKISFRSLFGYRQFVIYLAIAFVYYAASSVLGSYVTPMLKDEGINVSLLSTFLFLAVMCETPFIFLSTRYTKLMSFRTMLFIPYGIQLFMYICYTFSTPLWLKVAAMCIGKHVGPVMYTLTNIQAVKHLLPDRLQTKAFSLIQVISGIGNMLMINIFGNILDNNSYADSFRIPFIVCLAGACLVALFRFCGNKESELSAE